jgi:hypothetical protein
VNTSSTKLNRNQQFENGSRLERIQALAYRGSEWNQLGFRRSQASVIPLGIHGSVRNLHATKSIPMIVRPQGRGPPTQLNATPQSRLLAWPGRQTVLHACGRTQVSHQPIEGTPGRFRRLGPRWGFEEMSKPRWRTSHNEHTHVGPTCANRRGGTIRRHANSLLFTRVRPCSNVQHPIKGQGIANGISLNAGVVR